MKNRQLLGLVIVLVGLIILVASSQNASANFRGQFQGNRLTEIDQQIVETPVVTLSTSVAVIETPESRVLPPVGSNAGLVIGASVLVLIIIGGVLGSLRKPKH